MASHLLSEVAKEDIIRIHRFGIERLGESQADKYINTIFEKFEGLLSIVSAGEGMSVVGW
jgi:toxin ParE1/3/4